MFGQKTVAVLALAFCALPLAADCNTAPSTIDDVVGTLDVRAAWIAPLANDSDPDGSPLVLAHLNDTCLGAVSTEGDLFLYTPVIGQAETCTINYTAGDGTTSTPGSISITVTVLTPDIFADSFESGDTMAWTETVD